ncbi:MAG: eIF2 kinase Gcn2p negative regulator [Bogoriella megaspora]|nr:MAG: eIF2 kinase Gcn2p negative regulator [Bogoriella megaspora]
MNPTLEDELTSVNAIFDSGTLSLLPSELLHHTPRSQHVAESDEADSAPYWCALRLPSRPSIRLRLAFPPLYPEERPQVSGILAAGDESVGKGEAAKVQELAKRALERVWKQGDACIYDLVEECETVLTTEDQHSDIHDDGRELGSEYREAEHATGIRAGDSRHAGANLAQDEALSQSHVEDVSPQWSLSEPLQAKDSTFLARAASVHSPAEARAFIAHLVTTDKRAAKATHNISAYRIRSSGSVDSHAMPDIVYQDSDDDGESAAGGRLLKLCQMLDVWNVVVVVSRWFGGTLLGPERFRCINIVARDVLVNGGFAENAKNDQEQGKAKLGVKADKGKGKGK